MSRLISAVTFALVATALAANAQETTVKSKTRSSGGEAQTVTYTGCVQTGTQAKTYILDKVVPVSRTTTTDLSSGESRTSTTYMLVPGGVEVKQEYVGHKVEVTGTLVPGGDTKTETTTKVDRDGPDTQKRERVETKNAMPEFRVTSIKDLNEKC